MGRLIRRFLFVLCAGLAMIFPLHGQSRVKESLPVWGGLVRGPYPVGFRLYFERDFGRRDVPWSVEQEQCIAEITEALRRTPDAPPQGCDSAARKGNPQPSKELRFRPVLVAMWYPASALSSRVRLGDYSKAPGLAESPEFATRLSRFHDTAAQETVFRKPENSVTAEEERAFAGLLQMKTLANRDARVASGRFPLVIYHPGAGGSYDENAILFEFLASHGYVVVSSAYQTNTVHVRNDVGGASRSIRDMQFLIQAASKLPYVDITKIAAVGHSAGAQTLMQWIGEADCPLIGMVSLDSTLEYTPREFPGHKQLREALEGMEKPTIPVLLFASAERAPDFNTFEAFLRRSPRYEVSVSHLGHNEYLSHGALRASLILTTTDEEKVLTDRMRTSYDRVCLTIRRFLDFVLRAEERGRALLMESPADASTVSPLRVRYVAPH